MPRLLLRNKCDLAGHAPALDSGAEGQELRLSAKAGLGLDLLVQALKARGVAHIIEAGPGKVLTGMAKRIDAELQAACVFDPASLAEARTLLGA